MNTIAENIADFLKEHSPFNHLTFEELTKIATSIRVVNLQKNKVLFQVNDILHDSFYVVASGVINLSVIADAEEILLNKCNPGDILGLRPFFAKNNYMMTAKAREESIVYAIPIVVFRPFVANNSEVLNFLLESFAVNTRNPKDKENLIGKLISDNVFYADQQSEMQYFQSLSYNTTPLKTTLTAIAKDVAQLMTESLINNIVVCDNNFPLGIITDTDMRSKIATGRYPITVSVDKIMSSPVITVVENVSLAEAQLLMLKHNVTHLCVTQDGTDKSALKGIISEHDLIVAQANNPGVLIKEVKRCQSPKEIKQIRDRLTDLIQTSISKNIPLSHVFNIASEINLAIIKRSVELSILELGSPPARFAWLSIGSQGRKEQLLFTDQNSFLIFEDVANEKSAFVKDYFLKLANKVISILESVGYGLSQNNYRATNPEWCKSFTDWSNQFNVWMNFPGEKTNPIATLFFDFELAYGSTEIEENLNEIIFKNLDNAKKFLAYLGAETLKRPAPLTFFKQFNVEEEGDYKDYFDIKNRAILTLVDAARLLILSHKIKGVNNTFLRFKQLAIVEPKYSEIYLNAAEAFMVLTKIRTKEGLKNNSTGQFILIEELSKSDREKLKNALLPMKELEEIIKNKFQLTYFM